MQNKLVKISSFTIMDVLSGMVITSIIIGMVFSMFTVINQQLYSYTNTRAELNKFLLLKADLKRTIFDPNIHLNTVNNELFFERSGSKIHIFQSDLDLLRYTDNSIDTLSSKIENYYLIKSIEQSDKSTVDGVHLEVLVNKVKLTCDFYRQTDNAEQINKAILDGV